MSAEEDLKARIAALEAENAALKTKRGPGQFSLKVSEKGAVSLYGLGRFPVTLYKEQWEKVLENADTIRDFIKANEASLKLKEK